MKPVYIIFIDDPLTVLPGIAIHDTAENFCATSTAEDALRYLMKEPERCRSAHFDCDTSHALSWDAMDDIDAFFRLCIEGQDISVETFTHIYNTIISEV